MVYHISEDPGITRFEPRMLPTTDRPVVWAVSDDRVRNYLLPRDCPRVTFFAGERTTPADRDRLLGAAEAVVAFESHWLTRVRNTRLYCYHLPHESFTCVDRCAGYWQSVETVAPAHVEVFEDCLGALAARGVEIRIVPTLWPLHDQVLASSVSYSIIRMRNAAPRQAG
jgi:hypothetical protein